MKPSELMNQKVSAISWEKSRRRITPDAARPLDDSAATHSGKTPLQTNSTRLERQFALGHLAIFVCLALGLFVTSKLSAQMIGGTITGMIFDTSGAIVPNLQISIRNLATGFNKIVTTDGDGLYSAPNLLSGTYDVTISAPGFETQEQSGVTLTVGGQQVLNLVMNVGTAIHEVQTNRTTPVVQLTTSTISAVVDSTTVRDLPLNGRSWTDLATLQPGVSALSSIQWDFTGGPSRGNRGFGAQLSISGAKPTQNNYRLDGISINDYGNGAPGSVLGVNLGVDAIKEFSVLTSNYSAEYGKTSGGVVNAITTSGANQFHGDVYEFLRNEALDARNFFDKDRAPFRRNQFGGAAGAPIRKDQTFVFANYEGIRQSKGITFAPNVPSPNVRLGILSGGTPLPANFVCAAGSSRLDPSATICVDNSALKYLPMWPLPNGPIEGDRGKYIFAAQQIINENFFTTRIDHKISDKDSLFGTYMYDDAPYTSPDNLNDVLNSSHTNRQVVALEESHIFSPTLVNTVRVGYNRAGVLNFKGFSAINPVAGNKSLASIPGQFAPRVIPKSNIAASNGGPGTVSHYFHYWNSFQAYDDASLTRGTHTLKFGVAVEREQYNFEAFQNPGGLWRFGSLKNFLTNKPNSFESGLLTRISPRGMRQTIFGGYLQDDWRFRPNLTLNLGVRYEMATVLNEVQGKITNLRNITDPAPYCGKLSADPTCLSSGPYFSNPTLRNFEPRAGFSWDPFHNGKTAVRGGFGLFDVLPLPGYFLLQNNQQAPFFLLGTVSNTASTSLAGTFFNGGPTAGAGLASSLPGVRSLSASYVEQNPHRNYVMQWNLNVQREITPNLAATVSYVGSHGVHMMFRGDDGDMVIPTKTSAGYLFPCLPPAEVVGGVAYPCTVGNGTKINPNFGSIREIFWSTDSSYEALEVGIRKRISHGFQAQGSYTWGKAIDNNSSTIAGDSFANSLTQWIWLDPRISRAPADFNIGQSLVINGTWLVPTPHSLTGPAGALLGGWQLGSIFKTNTGLPFTPIIGGDPAGLLNGNAEQHAISSRVAQCNPVYGRWKTQNLNYVNVNCMTLPTPPPGFAAQCAPFGLNAGAPIPGTCANLFGNAGRNWISGPKLVNLDFSVFKNIHIKRISEHFNVQFRAEFFNVLNHASFLPPINNSTFFNEDGTRAGGAGQIDATATNPRDIQFALKLSW